MREKLEKLGIKIYYETMIRDINLNNKIIYTNKEEFKYKKI